MESSSRKSQEEIVCGKEIIFFRRKNHFNQSFPFQYSGLLLIFVVYTGGGQEVVGSFKEGFSLGREE